MASTSQILRALMSGDRLALIIALNPKAADVIPRGPLRSEFVAVSYGAEVALNPQPLPPAGIVVGARLMHKITAASLAGGRGFGGQFAEDLDDWCGTEVAAPLAEEGPVLGPQPDPWAIAQTMLGGMLAAAEISAHYDDPEVIGAFDKAIEMLGDAAVKQL